MNLPTALTVRFTKDADGAESLEVVADGYTTGHLGTDEALGCIASFLYRRDVLPHYLVTTLRDAQQRRRYGQTLTEAQAQLLRDAGESALRCGTCNGSGSVYPWDLMNRVDCTACAGKGWQ